MLTVGILGAAGIAPRSLIQPARRRKDVVIGAIASRSLETARAYAYVNGIPNAFGDYETLLTDPSIDLVYVALPPSEHAKWAIAALEAGKHVLCEKPLAMNAAEASRILATAEHTGKRLIEAFRDRYHPLSARISEIAESGRLGAIQSVRAEFSVHIPFDPMSIRHVPQLGGGALMDLDCYPVHWTRALLGEEPTVASAVATTNALGADENIEATLNFPSGVVASIVASMSEGKMLSSTLEIEGEREATCTSTI